MLRRTDPALAGVRTALNAELVSLAQSAQFGCFR